MSMQYIETALVAAERVKSCQASSWVLRSRSRDLVAGALGRISRSRDLLYYGGRRRISGGSAVADDGLRRRVFLGLMSGVLFPVTSRCWVGPGTGKVCIVCDQRIDPSDIEHEVDGPGGPVAAHQGCYTIWHQESEARRSLK